MTLGLLHAGYGPLLRPSASAYKTRLARLVEREQGLIAELADVQTARSELEHQRDVLSQFTLGAETTSMAGPDVHRLRALPATQDPPPEDVTILRGARIRETAVRILAARGRPDSPVHYRDWHELFVAQGFAAAGKDPLATFLTQIGRSPVVKRSTAAGMYSLDVEFPRRVRDRLGALTRELKQAPQPTPDAAVEDIASARRRRTRIAAEIQDMERKLDEAVRSLGTEIIDNVGQQPGGPGSPMSRTAGAEHG